MCCCWTHVRRDIGRLRWEGLRHTIDRWSQDAMESRSDAAVEYIGARWGFGASDYEALFRSMPAAVLAVDSAGAVAAFNPAAEELFGAIIGRPGVRCCDLV